MLELSDWKKFQLALAVRKMRVNIKSLAHEARIIREEARRTRNGDVKNGLHEHRRGRLREEARLAQLAYAFVRGVPYRTVEKVTRKNISPVQLQHKIERFAPYFNRPQLEDVFAWLEQE